MPSCDVIMPAYNNAATLRYTLRALFTQKLLPGWSLRLVASDDGSSDGTASLLKKWPAPRGWLPTAVVRGAHTGAAGARNRGLALSRADIVLLLGADIILRPGALAAHLHFHAARPGRRTAALGMIKWDPRLKPSPLMEWLAHGGPQNNFDGLLGQTTADPRRFFYGSHLSLKRSLLGAKPFSEAFRRYGWEDAELGRRLAAKGLRLHVLHRARSLHRHFYAASDVRRRQHSVGLNAVIYQSHYPRQKIIPSLSPLQAARYRLMAAWPALSALFWVIKISDGRLSLPRLFSQAARAGFWRGVYKGRKHFKTKLSP